MSISNNPGSPRTETTTPYQNVDPSVVGSIRQASQATNVDFNYLMAQAKQESGFQPDAKASNSSATGLFQFIDSTWLDMVSRHGQKYGIGELAGQIDRDAGGKPKVADPSVKKEILDLRKDPRISSLLAGEYAKANKTEVEHALGRPAGKADLYMAHFLGAGGATEFLKQVRKDGGAVAADILPDAAAANKNVFYDRKTGEPRTVADIYKSFAQRMERSGPDLPSMASIMSARPSSSPLDEAAPSTIGSFDVAKALGNRKLSAPVMAMFNVLALSALKLVGGGSEAEAQPLSPPQRELRHDPRTA